MGTLNDLIADSARFVRTETGNATLVDRYKNASEDISDSVGATLINASSAAGNATSSIINSLKDAGNSAKFETGKLNPMATQYVDRARAKEAVTLEERRKAEQASFKR